LIGGAALPPRILVPRSVVRSKYATRIAWFALPWAVGFAVVADAVLVAAGVPRGPRPWPVATVLVIVGWAPAITWLLAGSLGRLRPFAWLVAPIQPRLVLDTTGLEITDDRGSTVRLEWQQIAEIRLVHPASPSSVIGVNGARIARIPSALIAPRVEGGDETRLADEIAAFEPRLARQGSRRASRRLGLGLVLTVLLALGIVGVYLLINR
jgi:hypothetical protein